MMGPFYEAPFQQWWQNNPLMTRAKRDSLKRRVILDLSFPDDHSVNASIPKNALEGASFKLKLPRPDDLVARVRDLGKGSHMYKVDLSRAYRQLRSDPFDWALLGVQWQQENFVDVAIPFGLRHGASACQRTTSAVAEIALQFNALIHPYIDDSSAAETPALATQQYQQLLELMALLGLDAALDKCQPPSTRMGWVGVDFNSMTLIMSIDTGKIQEALVLCFAFLAKQEVTLKFMQRLMGKVFYSIRCMQAARHFTNRLLDLLKLARWQNTVSVTHEARLDAYWLTAFLPHFNGKTVMKPTDAE